MNPAGLTNCRYDNLQISVGDVFDGKWLYSSAACATPVNGVYSHSWHHTNNSSGSFANRINSLAIGSYLYLGHGAERFKNPAHPGQSNIRQKSTRWQPRAQNDSNRRSTHHALPASSEPCPRHRVAPAPRKLQPCRPLTPATAARAAAVAATRRARARAPATLGGSSPRTPTGSLRWTASAPRWIARACRFSWTSAGAAGWGRQRG
jgi:hypothetical protein